jgi:4-hydroxy-2-oxoheptanedioate aldolase
VKVDKRVGPGGNGRQEWPVKRDPVDATTSGDSHARIASRTLKQRLWGHEAILGIMLPVAEPSLVEICGFAGFQLVMVDMEHSMTSDSSAEHAVRAAESVGIHIVARASLPELSRLSRFLDCGGHGVIVSRVTDDGQARSVVNACCLPPRGSRGVGATRISEYGLRPTSNEWMAEESERAAIGVQIEDAKGVERAGTITAVDGIDFVLVGPRDLAIDLGVPGHYDSPEMHTAFAQIARACDRIGMAWAMPVDGVLASLPQPPLVQFRSLSAVISGGAQMLLQPHSNG